MRNNYLLIQVSIYLLFSINICGQIFPASTFTWEGAFTGNKAIWKIDDTLNLYKNIGGVDIMLKLEDTFKKNTTTTNPSDYNDYTKTNTFFGRGSFALQVTSTKPNQPVCLNFNFNRPVKINRFNIWDIDMLQVGSNLLSTYQDSLHFFAYNDTGRVSMDLEYMGANPIFDINGQNVKARYIANTNGDVLHTNTNGALLIHSLTPVQQLKICLSNGSEDDGLSNSHAIRINDFEFLELLGSISGTVFDSITGMPLSGSTLLLKDEDGNFVYNKAGLLMQNVTGPDGKFSFPALPIRSYKIVQTNPPGYESVRDIDAQNDNNIDVILKVGQENSNGNNFIEKFSSVLPVKLLNFDAEWLKEGITRLIWSTASESNNENFMVYLSDNGEQFKHVATIPSKGSSNSKQDYTFDFTNEIIGDSYIKLEQIDLDGRVQSLGIVKLQIGFDDLHYKIFPNPVENIINIKHNTKSNESLEYLIVDLKGSVLKRLITKEGDLSNQEIDISELAHGIYFLQLKSENNITTHKIIKK